MTVPVRGSVPKIGMGFGYDYAVFDQYAPPRNYSSVIGKIVPDYFELRLVSAMRVGIGNLLGLNVSVRSLLTILQPHIDIGRPPGAPPEIEIIAVALTSIQRSHGAKQSVGSLERNRSVLL